MRNSFSIGLALMAGLSAHAQTLNIRGKVSGPSGQAVAGAIVELAGLKLKDTTGADGMYSFSGTVGIGRQGLRNPGSMSLRGSVLELFLGRPQPVELDVFDVRGNLVKREVWETAAAGAHRWNLPERASTSDMLIVRATVGGEARTFHYLPMAGPGYASRGQADGSSPGAAPLAKAAADVDTLIVSAAGFATKKLPLTGFDAMVDVTLEAATDIWGGLKNPPGKSAGCGKPATLTNGKKTIASGGIQREYVIDIPANYDPATPYRLFYVGHGIPGMASDVPAGGWWALKSVVDAAKVPAIWIAPGAITGARGAWSTADNRDHVLFDDITALAKAGLCVDTTRIFATGMSGGGMLTNSLTSDRQKKIRAGVAFAPTNFNIWIPNPPLKDPVAWMQTTGMSDPICSWVASEAQKRGAKFIALEKAANNGCTIPAEIPTWKSGPHVCYDFAGCKPGYPAKVCTFNGPHTHVNMDPGSNVNWIAKEAVDFFMQF